MAARLWLRLLIMVDCHYLIEDVAMKGIVALCLVALLAGCSAKQVRPEVSGATLYRTPIEGATAQLVLSEGFQRKVITQKPTYGRAWSIFNFEIHVGEPASKSFVSDLRSRVPQARVGNIDDGKPSTIRLTPNDIAIEFGVDDGRAVALSGLSIFGLGADIVVGAKATIKADLSVAGKPSRPVEVIGVGVLPMAYISLRESDIDKAIGLALEDAAKKIGDMAEAQAKAESI